MSKEKEITADDILAESDDDDEDENESDGSQASGDEQIKLTHPKQMINEIDEHN